jgi:hypothetical protein
MALRYKDYEYVVGSELRNELRGSVVGGKRVWPVWGGGGENDWREAAIMIGNRILGVSESEGARVCLVLRELLIKGYMYIRLTPAY